MPQPRKPSGDSRRPEIVDLAERRRKAESARRAEVPADEDGRIERELEFERALAAVEGSPESRAARVAELKAQIADGTYDPDAEEIARKLLESGF